VAKWHQKFPSGRGYGPCVVPSRCHCLAWRSLFSAVPLWPLLAPLALLARFGRDECVTVAKRHQKFRSARGYGPCVVPSRCPCLAWPTLFSAVPFWPLFAVMNVSQWQNVTRSFLVRAATAPLWCNPGAIVLRGVAYFMLCPFGFKGLLYRQEPHVWQTGRCSSQQPDHVSGVIEISIAIINCNYIILIRHLEMQL
jgi:hypothetical protein